MFVYLNGAFLHREEARVPVTDRGLLLGLGAFETMRAYGGCVFRLEAHLERLGSTLAWMGVLPAEPMETLGEAAHALLGMQALDDARVRITVTAGSPGAAGGGPGRPTTLVTVGPVEAPPPEAYQVGISVVRHALPDGLGAGAGHKVTSYLGWHLARRAAREAGAGEALLVGAGERVVEGAHSNLFAVLDGDVVTPPLSWGALPGVTRAVILEILADEGIPGGERELGWADLLSAQEIFVTSSVAQVLPVTRLGEARVGGGLPGAITRRLAEAYRERVIRETARSRATREVARAG